MVHQFQNKYRIESARLKGWDYGKSAAYFITICTANRKHYLGEITCETMNLSPLGTVVEQEWLKSVALRPDMNLSLGEYVVMPNHFHAVIFIGDNEYNANENNNGSNKCTGNGGNGIDGIENDICIDAISGGDAIFGRDAMHGVSTDDTVMTDTQIGNPNDTGNKFGPQSKNLASVVRGFKSAVTTWARKNNIPFDWQPRFHDHIIRNTIEYNRISNYIINNPSQWQKDTFHS